MRSPKAGDSAQWCGFSWRRAVKEEKDSLKKPKDVLEVDRLLSDEERLIRDTVALGDLNVLGMHLDGCGCAQNWS